MARDCNRRWINVSFLFLSIYCRPELDIHHDKTSDDTLEDDKKVKHLILREEKDDDLDFSESELSDDLDSGSDSEKHYDMISTMTRRALKMKKHKRQKRKKKLRTYLKKINKI